MTILVDSSVVHEPGISYDVNVVPVCVRTDQAF